MSTQESGDEEEDRLLEFSAESGWEGACAQLCRAVPSREDTSASGAGKWLWLM